MRPLLIATSNAGKLREIRDILADVPYELRSLADLPPLVEPDETGATFEANAELKARYYSQATGLLTVADDSGLEVDALDKAPGVLSARFPGATYADKFATMFAMLDARGVESSTARFVCAIALVDGDRVVFEARGVVEGEIHAPNVVINGEVRGNVYSTARLQLASRAVVTGNLHYRLIEVVFGARIDGALQFSGDAPPNT